MTRHAPYMSYVVEIPSVRVHASGMTWEEETLVERLIRILRASLLAARRPERGASRSARIRYFLMSWGASHWAERV